MFLKYPIMCSHIYCYSNISLTPPWVEFKDTIDIPSIQVHITNDVHIVQTLGLRGIVVACNVSNLSRITPLVLLLPSSDNSAI